MVENNDNNDNDDVIVILTRLCTDMKWVKEELANHLKSHTKANFLAWSATAGAIIALILALLK